MEENWQHSARAIARFKAHKGMSDEEFEDFLDRVHHVCEHVFMHDFTTEILELLFKGINYDLDMDNTERIAEIRGRNERILSERRQRDGNILPHLGSNGGGDDTRRKPLGRIRFQTPPQRVGHVTRRNSKKKNHTTL